MCSALKAHNSSSFSFISFCFEARWASDLDLIFSILQRPRDLAQNLNWEMSESAKPLNMLNSLAFPILEDNGHLFHKSPGGIVDEGIFKKSTEDEEDADA